MIYVITSPYGEVITDKNLIRIIALIIAYLQEIQDHYKAFCVLFAQH